MRIEQLKAATSHGWDWKLSQLQARVDQLFIAKMRCLPTEEIDLCLQLLEIVVTEDLDGVLLTRLATPGKN